MGTLRIVDGEARRSLPLATSTLIGRGGACLVRLRHPAVPLYWLEVRWGNGAWSWRALAAEARTRGGGAFVGSGWRALTAAGGRAPRITLAVDVWVELLDAGPPRPFLTDVAPGDPVPAEQVDHTLEVRDDAIVPLSAEGDPAGGLPDGAVVRAGDRMVRVHIPTREADTQGSRLDLAAPDLELQIDVEALTARFMLGDAEVIARGACVRLLDVYVAAREADVPAGGWLTPDDAHAAWLARGGPADSSPARIAWERSKLRAQLSRAGATGLDALYEVRRDGDTVRTRVRVF